MTDTTLQEKVAVITGGGRGIGAAIARRLAALGAQTIICGRHLETLQKTTEEITKSSGRCLPILCDVAKLASVEGLSAELKSRFGRVDILVNNAGVAHSSVPLHTMDPKDWDEVFNINLRGVFYCIRSFVPLMVARGGHIINISSLAGKNVLPYGAAYSASKWGLNGLSYAVAEELRGNNIRVALICPGSVDTELTPHEGKDKSKILQPDDVAHAVTALVTQSPQSFISEVILRPTQKP